MEINPFMACKRENLNFPFCGKDVHEMWKKTVIPFSDDNMLTIVE